MNELKIRFVRCLFCVTICTSSVLFFMQGAHAQTSTEDTFIPNLKNVSINTLIETVSERTGKNFIVDPRVNANVTVVSSENVNADELYSLLLSVLSVHGFVAVEAGSFIKIVPIQVGVQSAGTVIATQPSAGDKLVTKVMPMKSASATQLIEVLRPLVSAQGNISAEANTNTLIITDRASNVERLIDVINSLYSDN